MFFKVYYQDSLFSTHPDTPVGDREAHANLGFLAGRQKEGADMSIHKGPFTESCLSTAFKPNGHPLKNAIAYVRKESK